MSVFDPDTFMDATLSEPNSIRSEPVPIGEYTGIIKEVQKPRQLNESIVMNIVWSLQDDALAEKLNRKEVTVRQSLFLDVTDSGALDMGKGKNVGLGRLREALDMNASTFNFNMLNGAGPARVVVSHREDKNNPGEFFDNVSKVAKL